MGKPWHLWEVHPGCEVPGTEPVLTSALLLQLQRLELMVNILRDAQSSPASCPRAPKLPAVNCHTNELKAGDSEQLNTEKSSEQNVLHGNPESTAGPAQVSYQEKNPDCFQRKINGCGIHVRLAASKRDALVLDFCYGLNGEQDRGSAGRRRCWLCTQFPP